MERVLLSQNQYLLYFSLRFEKTDPFKNIFCLECPLRRNACSADTSVADRTVAKINLNHPQLTEVVRQNLRPNCGDISDLLK